ncbi:MAG: hypothetical protein H7A25_26550 [Leptospiraceae bacterium]|nr:hypothetical protein [Leptospiraceae bacterium]
MELEQQKLYNDILNFEIDEKTARVPYSHRLSKENNWTLDFTRRVILEYKKFVFLAIVCDRAVTPSKVIDEAWHLHMIYTHSYWDEFCAKVLNFKLHHVPGNGNEIEEIKFKQQYQKTLDSYKHYFGELPPSDIWGAVEVKPAKKKSQSLKKTKQLSPYIIFLSCLYLISCENPFNFSGPNFLIFYAVVFILMLLFAIVLRMTLPRKDPILYKWLPAIFMFITAVVGLAKIEIGIRRNKPVLYLIIASIISLFVGILFLIDWKTGRGGGGSIGSSRHSSCSDHNSSCSSTDSSSDSSSSGCGGCSSSD